MKTIDKTEIHETEETLKKMQKVFYYNPETGDLSYRLRRGIKFPGDVAGFEHGGYLAVEVSGRKWLIHRLAWALHYGHWPKGTIDHKNRVKDDNRIDNLRDVPQGVNNRNKGAYKGRVVKGIYLKKGLYWDLVLDRRHIMSSKCFGKVAKEWQKHSQPPESKGESYA